MKMRKILGDLLGLGLDKFTTLKAFYSWKNHMHFGLFSCHAGETFPDGWVKAIASGVWNEEGVYGDNFRETFDLNKQ